MSENVSIYCEFYSGGFFVFGFVGFLFVGFDF